MKIFILPFPDKLRHHALTLQFFIYFVKIHMKHTINHIPNVYFKSLQKLSQTVHIMTAVAVVLAQYRFNQYANNYKALNS